MDRAQVLLQQLQSQVQTWMATIQRGVGATACYMKQGDGGEFTIEVVWKTPEGEKTFSRHFSREYVFGPTLANPMAVQVQHRACDYARAFMREVLTQRGAIT